MNLELIFRDTQEEGIDQLISDAKTCEDSQGEKLKLKLNNFTEQIFQENVWRRKQKRVRDLLTSLNRLSASLFAAISVAKRQVAVLQDLHSIFTTRGQTKTKDHEGRYPLRQNLFLDIAPIPILSKNPEQIWASDLTTINEVVQERKPFIKKVKELVENMDIRRKIV